MRKELNIDVSVIVVNYNTSHLLDRMFAALETSKDDLNLQVIVVDNASRDNSLEHLRTYYPNITLIENTVNVGFGRANNQAAMQADGRYILLLNTDAFLSPDTLKKTVNFMDTHPQCGVLGVKLIGPEGELQPSCRYFPTPWNVFLARTSIGRFFPNSQLIDDMSWDHGSVRNCDWVPGCFYLMRRQVIDQVGLFDPRFFLYSEEVDHCRSVRKAGWEVTYYPFTEVVHLGGESAVSEGATMAGRQISALQVESELLYFRKHYGVKGIIGALVLTIVQDLVMASAALILHFNFADAVLALRHVRSVFSVLQRTDFASRATR